jgi:hypothetical protein
MKRVCIYPKDISVITGRSERWGRNLIKKIKSSLNKETHHLVTIDEFCQYTGISTDYVKNLLPN